MDTRNEMPATPRRHPPGPAVVPHRKNAAEWVMWSALWPVAAVLRWCSWSRAPAAEVEHGREPKRTRT